MFPKAQKKLMREQSREILLMFIEKSEELISSSFAQYILLNNVASLRILIDKSGFSIKEPFPNIDSLRAFVLTFRFFIQDRDQISLRALEDITNDPGISTEWKESYRQIRREINNFLNSKVRITSDGEQPTYRQVQEAFLYGDLAHLNKRDILLRWRNDDDTYRFRQHDFRLSLLKCLEVISRLSQLCQYEVSRDITRRNTMGRTVSTSTTHDGIYITTVEGQVRIDDKDIREAVNEIAKKNTITVGSTTLRIPQDETQQIIKELLYRLDESGIENH